ncbi:MAG: alkaline phosphatase family protein [Actinomycetota bacterium]|nr:alkaline phosphatase family protein [Actinomycetota bacterium]
MAIGIDAAEPALVRWLIEQGELPALGNLLEGGTWRRIDSPAHIGSGAVWPTFFTGTSPAEHGVYSYWGWDSETMSLAAYERSRFTPFWKSLARSGATVGILDVPFAPFVGLSEGFEVSQWGPHDLLEEGTRVSPTALLDAVTKDTRPHPFSSHHHYLAGPESHRERAKLSSACLEGVRLRGSLAERLIAQTAPEVAVIVFTEVHRAAHFLWHTVAPEHRLYQGDAVPKTQTPALLDIYREVDQQIARLIEVGGSGATVLVFSLHGMRPGRGIPTILEPLLCDLGLARLADWSTQSWTERARSVLAAAKHRAPHRLKKLYHNMASHSVRLRLARQTMLPAYDWSCTRVLSVPSDQHGWIRLNLLGREAEGIVRPEQYDETCDLLEDVLRTLTTEDGRLLVRDVLRLSSGAEEALRLKLPDLVIHWHEAAFESPVRIKNSSLQAYPTATQLTGQHAPDGFCIINRGAPVAGGVGRTGEPIAAKDLPRLIVAALVASGSDDGARA